MSSIRSAAAPTFSTNVKVCVVVHSDENCYCNLVKRIGYASNAVVAVSSHLGRKLKADFPDLAARMEHIPSGVPGFNGASVNRGEPACLRLVYSNRLTQLQKRIFDLPLLVEKLSRSGVDFRLVIAGEGPDEAELQKRFNACCGGERVTMAGRLSAIAVRNLLAESDIVLLVSDFEGLPMSLLEAMSTGCVPVVYDIKSGVRDAIENGANRFLVPHGHVSAMVRIIADLGGNRMRLSSPAQNCVRTHEERFSSKRMAASFKSLFRELMTGIPRGARRDGKIRLTRDLQCRYRIMLKVGLIWE